MKYVKHKIFTIGAFEQEEKWLNEMAAKGMLLTDVGFCRYVFEEGTPGKYIYRLEMLENTPTHPESVAYIKFVEETGAEQVGSIMRWVYFRKKAVDGPFDLYSDLGSKLKHYRRIHAICNIMIPLELLIGAINMSVAIMGGGVGGFREISSQVNISVGLLCLGLGIWFICISSSIYKKIKVLKKESAIRE